MVIFRKSKEDFLEAKLTGGLGNQLFIFAAAYAIAKRLDCKLILDTSDFNAGNIRSLEIAHFENEQIKFQDLSKDRKVPGKI